MNKYNFDKLERISKVKAKKLYIAFYVKREKIAIHFEFVNGSNPYIFRGSVLECLEELEKWAKNWNITPIKQSFYKLEEVAR